MVLEMRSAVPRDILEIKPEFCLTNVSSFSATYEVGIIDLFTERKSIITFQISHFILWICHIEKPNLPIYKMKIACSPIKFQLSIGMKFSKKRKLVW